MINRPDYLSELIKYKDKDLIKTITGVRRSGKSTLLFDLYYKYLLKEGIKKDHIITINLENLDNINLRIDKYLYQHIKSQIKDKKKYYIFIDEIQYVNDFEDICNTFKNEGHDLYITDSNSKLLSKDISTKLRGRNIEIKVYPLSFKEYFSISKLSKEDAFKEYMLYGGFPYIANENDKNIKVEYLKMLENTIATKDIIDRYKLKHENMFNAVYDFLCSNIGSTISAKKISDTLKTNGYKTITPDTIGNYLEYLFDAFLFYKVYRYDIKGKEYLKTLNKYYAADIGLRNVKLGFRQIEPTHTLENIIYLELLRRKYEVDIGKNNDKEIDFIAKNEKTLNYIQVAYSILNKDKKEKELASFKKLDDGYKKIIITMDNDPFNNLENG